MVPTTYLHMWPCSLEKFQMLLEKNFLNQEIRGFQNFEVCLEHNFSSNFRTILEFEDMGLDKAATSYLVKFYVA